MKNGTISISRVDTIGKTGDRDDEIRITFTDGSSGIQFMEVKVSTTEFMRALTNLGFRPCDYVLRSLQNVGKKREVKTVLIPLGKDEWVIQNEDEQRK